MVSIKRETVSLLGRFIQLCARQGLKVALSSRLPCLCKLSLAACQPATGLAGSTAARNAGVRAGLKRRHSDQQTPVSDVSMSETGADASALRLCHRPGLEPPSFSYCGLPILEDSMESWSNSKKRNKMTTEQANARLARSEER